MIEDKLNISNSLDMSRLLARSVKAYRQQVIQVYLIVFFWTTKIMLIIS